jgi:NhaA family Na+:H+ antiporter
MPLNKSNSVLSFFHFICSVPLQASFNKIKQRSKFFAEFAKSQEFAGLLLLLATAVSLLIANSPWGSVYHHWIDHHTVQWFVNDALMALFFLLVGLEIKRELLVGELSKLKQAALPIMGALGGMLIPALFFIAFNHHENSSNGWAIPTATDIAFAVGILNIIGKKVPNALKVFITALAVVDDLGAVLIIAIFYSQAVQLLWLALLILSIPIASFALKRTNAYRIPLLMSFGVLFFFLLHQAHLHTTLAGVLLAAVTPFDREGNHYFIHQLERALHKPVNFFILPLFALVNTAISLQFDTQALHPSLLFGIVLGLLIGKPLGISAFSWLATKMGIAQLPKGVTHLQLVAVSVLGGIGFTMSIFISILAFTDVQIVEQSKSYVLLASLLCLLLSYAIIKRKFRY